MPAEQVLITAGLIESGRSSRGMWSRKQLALLGIEWPLLRGWYKQAIGKKIPKANANMFIQLRDCHLRDRYPAGKVFLQED